MANTPEKSMPKPKTLDELITCFPTLSISLKTPLWKPSCVMNTIQAAGHHTNNRVLLMPSPPAELSTAHTSLQEHFVLMTRFLRYMGRLLGERGLCTDKPGSVGVQWGGANHRQAKVMYSPHCLYHHRNVLQTNFD